MPEEHTQQNTSTETNPTSSEEIVERVPGGENTVPPVVTEAQNDSAQTGHKRTIVIVLIVVGVLIVIGYFFLGMNASETPLGDAQAENNLGAVATVNGVEINREEYDRSLGSLSQNAALQGANTADPAVRAELESQALTMVVNNELLVQSAANAGYGATQEETDVQFQAVVEQFGGIEELNTRLNELGITEEDLRSDIERQIAVNAYVNTETGLDTVTVTEEEIDAFIATLNFDEADMPPMEQIRPQIEASLIAQKQQELIDSFIESLRGTAEIQELI